MLLARFLDAAANLVDDAGGSGGAFGGGALAAFLGALCGGSRFCELAAVIGFPAL